MRLVIPCFTFPGAQITDQLLLLSVTLKSYFYHGNELPITIPVTSPKIYEVVTRMIAENGWGATVELINENDFQSRGNSIIDGMWSRRRDVFMSKMFTLVSVCPDEDIFMMDYDVMFTGRVDWESEKGNSIKAYMNSSVWNHHLHFSINKMLGMENLDRSMSHEPHIDVQSLLLEFVEDGWDFSRLSDSWINGGLSYFSKEYRKNKLLDYLNIFKTSRMEQLRKGDDERIYLDLYMKRSPDFELSEDTLLNLPAGYFDIASPDIRNIQDECKMVHFQNFKPHNKLGFDGVLKLGGNASIWQMDYYSRSLEVEVFGSPSMHKLCLLWHWYYSMVSEWISPHVGKFPHFGTGIFGAWFDTYADGRTNWRSV